MDEYQALELVRRCYQNETTGNGHDGFDIVEDEYRRARENYPVVMSLALARFIQEQCGEQHGGAREQCMDCGGPVEVEGRELCFACYCHHQG